MCRRRAYDQRAFFLFNDLQTVFIICSHIATMIYNYDYMNDCFFFLFFFLFDYFPFDNKTKIITNLMYFLFHDTCTRPGVRKEPFSFFFFWGTRVKRISFRTKTEKKKKITRNGYAIIFHAEKIIENRNISRNEKHRHWTSLIIKKSRTTMLFGWKN